MYLPTPPRPHGWGGFYVPDTFAGGRRTGARPTDFVGRGFPDAPLVLRCLWGATTPARPHSSPLRGELSGGAGLRGWTRTGPRFSLVILRPQAEESVTPVPGRPLIRPSVPTGAPSPLRGEGFWGARTISAWGASGKPRPANQADPSWYGGRLIAAPTKTAQSWVGADIIRPLTFPLRGEGLGAPSRRAPQKSSYSRAPPHDKAGTGPRAPFVRRKNIFPI